MTKSHRIMPYTSLQSILNECYSKIQWRNIHMKIMSCMSNFAFYVTRTIDMNHLSARVAFSEVKLLNIVRNSSRTMIYGLSVACCLWTKAIRVKLITLAYITINLHHVPYVSIFFIQVVLLHIKMGWTKLFHWQVIQLVDFNFRFLVIFIKEYWNSYKLCWNGPKMI